MIKKISMTVIIASVLTTGNVVFAKGFVTNHINIEQTYQKVGSEFPYLTKTQFENILVKMNKEWYAINPVLGTFFDVQYNNPQNGFDMLNSNGATGSSFGFNNFNSKSFTLSLLPNELFDPNTYTLIENNLSKSTFNGTAYVSTSGQGPDYTGYLFDFTVKGMNGLIIYGAIKSSNFITKVKTDLGGVVFSEATPDTPVLWGNGKVRENGKLLSFTFHN